MKRKLFSIVGTALIAVSLLAAPASAAGSKVSDPGAPKGIKTEASKSAPEGFDASANSLKGKPSNKRQNRSVTTCVTGSPCFDYAGKRRNMTDPADGYMVTADIAKPNLLGWDYHSLFELAAMNSTQSEIVEVGWTVDQAVCGTGVTDPCLFTFAWRNGNPLGYYSGLFQQSVGTPVPRGGSLASAIGTSKSFSIRHYDTAGCGCSTAGWWISYDGNWLGVWPDTIWTGASPAITFTEANVLDTFGELSAGLSPTQSKIGNGQLASTTQGAQVVLNSFYGSTDTLTLPNSDATEPDRWNDVAVNATTFRYGGPGGTETIPGVVTADDTPGVGTGTNPSGLGAFCTFQTQVSNVPKDKVTCIDGSAGTACRGNVGTSAGYAPIRNVALSLYKKVTVWNNGTCSGTGLQLNHGRIILPTSPTNYQAQANFSYRVDSVYANCATGYPGTAPTC